jgi:hypothetical protein
MTKIGTGMTRGGPQAARTASEKDADDTTMDDEYHDVLQHSTKKAKS